MAKSELLSSISSIVIRDPRSEIRNPKSKIEAEAYLNGTSQSELVLSLSKEHPWTPGFRLVEPTARREGRPYPWSAVGGFMKYPGLFDNLESFALFCSGMRQKSRYCLINTRLMHVLTWMKTLPYW